LLAAHGGLARLHVWLAVAFLALGWLMKAIYWSALDAAPRDLTAGTATGLGRFGEVRQVEAPHTQANFVMREMGFEVARRHVETLRPLAVVLAFVVPIALLVAGYMLGGLWAMLLAVLAVVASAFGILTERWLFFAEAEHVAMLYYGRQAA
jgi:DMSO reductase anchor subunit